VAWPHPGEPVQIVVTNLKPAANRRCGLLSRVSARGTPPGVRGEALSNGNGVRPNMGKNEKGFQVFASAPNKHAHHTRPHAGLLSEEVVEGLDGFEFVVADVEDGIELRDVEDIVHLLGQVE
jgi:hypothetical protein